MDARRGKKKKLSDGPEALIMRIAAEFVKPDATALAELERPNKAPKQDKKPLSDSPPTKESAPPAAADPIEGVKKRKHEQTALDNKQNLSKRPKKQSRKDEITGDPSMFSARKALPIWEWRDRIRKALSTGDVLVLAGEPGSGKSTQVPQFLCTESWCKGMVAITQPRRIAATSLAHRVACEMGTPLEASYNKNAQARGRVGYSVRFDYQMPRGTKVKFLTEGMLLQEMIRDPALRKYSAVVVDEVHERSVDVDLLLGFLKQILAANRPGGMTSELERVNRSDHPLKVVVMSATADIDKIRDFFTTGKDTQLSAALPSSPLADVIQIPGRQHPVEIIHTPAPVPDINEAILKTVFDIHVHEPLPGDILVFLTGQDDIGDVRRLIENRAADLASNVPRVEVCPLYGQLPKDAQDKALQPLSRPFTRKIILATNIAETSVTVPGVKYVVDNGKAKVKQWRPSLGLESLLKKPISKSSAIQRAGRAGREGPGKCFRMYTEDSYENVLEPVDLPEILRTDIMAAVLTMKALGIDNVFTFPLMDAPDKGLLERGLVRLHDLGALDDEVNLTKDGKLMSRLPISAPYGRALLTAVEAGCALEVIDIIACLTAGGEIFQKLESEQDREEIEMHRAELHRREGDLLTYLTTLQRMDAEKETHWKKWCKTRRISVGNMRQAFNIRRQLRSLCVNGELLSADDVPGGWGPHDFLPLQPDRANLVLRCFLRGFALRTAVLAADGSYLTTRSKQTVAIHPSSVLHGQKREAIMFMEQIFTQKNYAKQVSAIQAAWIDEAQADWIDDASSAEE